MMWAELNQRQQEYLKAIYEVDQEQEEYERGAWNRGGRPRPAREWRWMEYGTFYSIPSPLKMKIFLRDLQDEGTGSTFDALERRGLITCKYTWERRNGEQVEERLLMVQITKEGRKLVRAATGEQGKKALPAGTLREWHWKAMAMAWEGRPEGVMASGGWYGDYGRISWNTWLRLRDYKAGALVKEYHRSEPYSEARSRTLDTHWIRLTSLGEEYYRENWSRYREIYPEVEAPEPEKGQE
jgi:hypothetical protein